MKHLRRFKQHGRSSEDIEKLNQLVVGEWYKIKSPGLPGENFVCFYFISEDPYLVDIGYTQCIENGVFDGERGMFAQIEPKNISLMTDIDKERYKL